MILKLLLHILHRKIADRAFVNKMQQPLIDFHIVHICHDSSSAATIRPCP